MLSAEERKEILANPFKRMRDKVALVGFSQKTRDMAPFLDPTYEIWGLNEEYCWFPKKVGDTFLMESWLKTFDRWFQLHPRADAMRENNTNDRNHPYWLTQTTGVCKWCNGTKEWENYLNGGIKEKCPFCKDGVFIPDEKRQDLTIYMQQQWDDIPGSVEYPLDEVVDRLMPQTMKETKRGRYFRSSPAFMMALAAVMGFTTIDCYGFEMGTDTEYHYQRANFEYLIGLLSGMGLTINVPAESSLLHGELYAYETLKVGYRQDLELRKLFMEARVKNAEIETKVAEGKYIGLRNLEKEGKFSPEDIKAAVKAAKVAHAKAQGMQNFKRGAAREVEMQISMYDAYFNSETRETVEKTEQLVNTDYIFELPGEKQGEEDADA